PRWRPAGRSAWRRSIPPWSAAACWSCSAGAREHATERAQHATLRAVANAVRRCDGGAHGVSRVAFVVPRYGPEIGGGAEEKCRRLAELLADDVEVTVLTTCSLDYRTWADHYQAGEEVAAGVRVLRFGVTAPRDLAAFDALSAAAYARPAALQP